MFSAGKCLSKRKVIAQLTRNTSVGYSDCLPPIMNAWIKKWVKVPWLPCLPPWLWNVRRSLERSYQWSQKKDLCLPIITACNEVVVRKCFYTCLWFRSQGGGGGLCPGGLCPGGGVSVKETPYKVTCGRYVSYWNALLFLKKMLQFHPLNFNLRSLILDFWGKKCLRSPKLVNKRIICNKISETHQLTWTLDFVRWGSVK